MRAQMHVPAASQLKDEPQQPGWFDLFVVATGISRFTFSYLAFSQYALSFVSVEGV